MMIFYLHTGDPVIVSCEEVKDNKVTPLGHLLVIIIMMMLMMMHVMMMAELISWIMMRVMISTSAASCRLRSPKLVPV